MFYNQTLIVGKAVNAQAFTSQTPPDVSYSVPCESLSMQTNASLDEPDGGVLTVDIYKDSPDQAG